MKDYIASPKPSGYRAFVTTVLAVDSTNPLPNLRRRASSIQFHIYTPEMHDLNEWGVIAWYRNRNAYDNVPMWWVGDRALSHRLLRDFAYPHGIQQFLTSDQGDRPLAIYAFTPTGELKLLPPRSTVLDFAYSIHSSMGDEATRFAINGQTVQHNSPVQNGDVVVVERGLYPPRPEFSWLTTVQTKKARDRIGQRLRRDAVHEHPAMAQLQAYLSSMVLLYRRERQFELNLGRHNLQRLINYGTQARHLDRTNDYLDLIQSGDVSALRLVHRLINDELSERLVDQDGRAPSIPSSRTSFCQACRPVPGDIIVGVHNTRRLIPRLVVHRPACRLLKHTHTRQTPMAWQADASANQLLTTLNIRARDRAGLLRELLDATSEESLQVHHVEAKVDEGWQADIRLTVGGRTVMHHDGLASVLANIKDVLQVFPGPTLRKNSQRESGVDSGYSELPAFGAGFYDREDATSEISRWAVDPTAQRWLIVHGEGRVGKTSLVLHFGRAVAPRERLGSVIDIDAQSLPVCDFDSLCLHLARATVQVSTKAIPPLGEGADAADWLLAILEDIAADSIAERLIIVIDEFSWLVDHNTDPTLWGRLSSLIERSRRIRWILVVHDHLYRQRWVNPLGRMLRGPHLHLTHLNSFWALKLITEPVTRTGCQMDPTLADHLLYLTNGNPYLISMIGRELIQRAGENPRKVVDRTDLDRASSFALAEGKRLFWHYDHSIQGWTRLLFTALAGLQCPRRKLPNGEPAVRQKVPTLSALKRTLRHRLPKMDDSRFEKSLRALRQRELVVVVDGAVWIPIVLLAHWWSSEKILKKEIDSFQASRLPTRPEPTRKLRSVRNVN